LFPENLSRKLLRQGEAKAESDIGIHPQEGPGSMRFVKGAVKKELKVKAGRKQVIGRKDNFKDPVAGCNLVYFIIFSLGQVPDDCRISH
jgi:hypothetical protein